MSAVVQVVAGAHHSCAIHKNGRVTCWGLAESINAGGAAILRPTEIPDVREPRALAAGKHRTCAITSDARVRCWGNRSFDVVREDGTPLGEVSSLALGPEYGCAATASGVHCWGKNEFGQLGRPLDFVSSDAAVLSAPGPQRFLGAGVAVVAHDGGDRLCAWGHNLTKVVTGSDDTAVYPSPQCSTLPDVAALTVGGVHACVRHARGTFACWGERYYGQLGIGGTDTADVPPPGSTTMLANGPVAGLVAGVAHTCALLENGTVACFGFNRFGQIGPGPDTPEEEVRSPTPVTGFSARVLALGSGSSADHTCAVLAEGQVVCWGKNENGQLGNGVVAQDPQRFARTPVLVWF